MQQEYFHYLFGKGTKISKYLINHDKVYEAEIKLGKKTDTADREGKILEEKTVQKEILNEENINRVLKQFLGKQEQIPPMYSAIKVNGKKLYEYARAGVEIDREKRPVEIISIDDLRIEKPFVHFSVKCSKGTYIRSLCRDIGEKLGCGAVLSGLIRNELHGMYAKDAVRLSEIEALRDDDALDRCIISMDYLLKDYESYDIKPQAAKLLLNGNKLNTHSFLTDVSCEDGCIVRVYDMGRLIALYIYDAGENNFRPYKMFL